VPPASAEKEFVAALDPPTAPPGLERAVYAIGNFDGAHLGHAAVIARTMRVAGELDAPSAALTFEPHPADFFAGRPVVFRLGPASVKVRALRDFGLDGVVTLTFDAALASLTAEQFVARVLVERLGVGAVVVGWDFHFGKGRGGSPAFLLDAGRRYGFRVEVIGKVEAATSSETAAISSTAIRRALEAGDVEAAQRLLGRPYSIVGTVIEGRKLGRTLGIPTANIALEATNRLAHGVYVVEALVDGVRRGGVASFGTRPTVDDGAPMLEVFLFDFSGDLYGQGIEVAFLAHLRPEQKFDNLKALKRQMDEDAAEARALLKARRAV
jgi:riboflavin kinase / FMN adenylyltransferase